VKPMLPGNFPKPVLCRPINGLRSRRPSCRGFGLWLGVGNRVGGVSTRARAGSLRIEDFAHTPVGKGRNELGESVWAAPPTPTHEF